MVREPHFIEVIKLGHIEAYTILLISYLVCVLPSNRLSIIFWVYFKSEAAENSEKKKQQNEVIEFYHMNKNNIQFPKLFFKPLYHAILYYIEYLKEEAQNILLFTVKVRQFTLMWRGKQWWIWMIIAYFVSSTVLMLYLH